MQNELAEAHPLLFFGRMKPAKMLRHPLASHLRGPIIFTRRLREGDTVVVTEHNTRYAGRVGTVKMAGATVGTDLVAQCRAAYSVHLEKDAARGEEGDAVTVSLFPYEVRRPIPGRVITEKANGSEGDGGGRDDAAGGSDDDGGSEGSGEHRRVENGAGGRRKWWVEGLSEQQVLAKGGSSPR